MTDNTPDPSVSLPNEFLSRLVAELNDDNVTAIMLHGSYARGNAVPPYSDVDLVRIVQEIPNGSEKKRFIYRDDYLISISSRPLSVYREWFATPEKAIFAVPGVREARILLDKDGAFSVLQQEAQTWMWEPLQAAANDYAGQVMMEETELVLKVLRALMLHDPVALSDMILDLFSAVTEAIAVQRGVLVFSGNTYFHQVQEAIGRDSMWTRYHLLAAGIKVQTASVPSIEERGIAVLRLYQETAQLLRPYVHSKHWEVIARSMGVIEHTLSNEKAL